MPLPNGIPAVPVLATDMLPACIGAWVSDISERMQCPLEYPAVAAIMAAGSLIGRTVTMRPKRCDDWAVVPNLWGAIIGRPGVLKSPAMREALRPLSWPEATAAEDYEEAAKHYDATKELRDAEKWVRSAKIKKSLKKGNRDAAFMLAADNDEAPEPVRKRYIVNDSTVEKLGEILRANPRGIIVFRDELSGFFHTLEKEGREADRAFYREAWQGDGRFSYDRIGRGTVDIPAACVSILGSIQPGPLSGYLAAAARGGLGDDGLIQRFQVTVWPDVPKTWKNCDRWPANDARTRYQRAFYELDNLSPDRVGAAGNDDGLPYLHFERPAQDVFDVWRGNLEARLRTDDLLPILEAHLAKYRSLVPSLALIFHLLDGQAGPVGLPALLLLAIRWAEFLEAHARRTYSAVINADLHSARVLARRIRARDLESTFTPREVLRHGWESLSSQDDVEAAVQVLADHSWLMVRTERNAGRGRPSRVCDINPRVYEPTYDL